MKRIVLNIAQTDEEMNQEWNKIDWQAIQRFVERIQGQIFQAAKHKNYKELKSKQRLATRSYYCHLYAIHQITVVNKGKGTPGVDGIVCKTTRDRVKLLTKLKTFKIGEHKAEPVKRTDIPKASGGTRPLGIPTVYDRVVQTLLKIALEAEWEFKFHANSYGFRPGRGCQDAIEKIKDHLTAACEVYVLDADITGFFDNISHDAILTHFPPLFRTIIGKWLKAGIVEKGYQRKPTKGTPQGGVISPLLANIILNEFDHLFNPSKEDVVREFATIRYADDFVVISKDKHTLIKCFQRMKDYFEEIGLRFNETKTHIVSKSEGFHFLGFRFIQYPLGDLKVLPARENIKRVKRNLKRTLVNNKQAKTDGIIYRLNTIIRGWGNYYRFCSAWKSFHSLDNIIFRWIWNWCKRRHPRKSKRWIQRLYFKKDNLNRNWVLTGKHWRKIFFSEIKRLVYGWRVGDMSPMDPLCRDKWTRKPFINASPQHQF
jgi:RNA-directed DNA polymerase